ncbi:hypothetical protein [Candidatus Pelagibacter communis]|uniref:hypothetical protein n=1 Tax=Pelagibacter ubique TaxID=198252 RepID=UPI00065B3AF2|nr:hypothetical protein [Candidatus Pelagibacter ubique]
MNLLSVADSKIKQSTDFKILKHDKNIICMLVVTDKSYVYIEKYYFDGKIVSSLTVEIFKSQEKAIINYDSIKALLFKNIVENLEFKFKEFAKSLRKERIYFHKWFEKDGVINTNTY